MGLLASIATPLERLRDALPLYQLIILAFTAFITLSVVLHVARQLFFKDKNAPPEVFSLFPIFGNTYVHPGEN